LLTKYYYNSTFSNRIQEEREERHRVKAHLKPSRFEPVSVSSPSTSKSSLALGPVLIGMLIAVHYVKNVLILFFSEEKTGSFDVGDPNTTNIYLGNINPKVSFEYIICCFYQLININ
jgi:hypothetical protein